MAVTNYFTMNGEVVGQETGGVRLDYLTDALGSVTGLVDQSGSVVWRARSHTYGTRFSLGSTPPDFQWNGSSGYRPTDPVANSLNFADHYVRARHYTTDTGAWTTKDPLWPSESAYGYVGGRVALQTDPTGSVANVGITIGVVVGIVSCALLQQHRVAPIEHMSDPEKHCVTTCLIAKNCGLPSSLLAILGSEFWDLLAPLFGMAGDFDWKDMIDNSKGFVCGAVPPPLFVICERVLDLHPNLDVTFSSCKACCDGLNAIL